MKKFLKTVFSLFKTNLGKFIVNLLIIVLSSTIITGLGALTSIYERGYSDVYSSQKISDIIVKNTTTEGFSDEVISNLLINDNIEAVSSCFVSDFELNDGESATKNIYRVYYQDFYDNSVNRIQVTEGRYPTERNEILIEKPNRNTIDYKIGDKVELALGILGQFGIQTEYTIVGYVDNPQYISIVPEVSYLNQEDSADLTVDSIIYIDSNLNGETLYPYPTTDINIKLKNPDTIDYFNSEYSEYVQTCLDSISKQLNDSSYVYLTLEENVSFNMFEEYMNKIDVIALVFPFFFLAVCILVMLITISRLIAEERNNIACYISLGVQTWKVYFKYLLFIILASIVGGFIGLLIGLYLLPYVVYPAVYSMFYISTPVIGFDFMFGLILIIAILVSGIIITSVVLANCLKEKPAKLFQAKAPKPGKKNLLERIKFIWKKLPFKYKSSIRNLARNKKNLILTLLAIIGSYALLFLGFGLLDITKALETDSIYSEVASSMQLISTVIVFFALGMCTLIVYNLANMNISERQRELATLKVLGYTDIECSLYTFREIFITSILGLILSIPVGYFVDKYIFMYLDFGSIDDVKWYSYLGSFLIIFVATILINFMLYPKIKKVNMNDSLKILE